MLDNRATCGSLFCCAQLVKDYIASGRLEKDIDFSVDDKILAAVNA